jgi:hypothetical protein
MPKLIWFSGALAAAFAACAAAAEPLTVRTPLWRGDFETGDLSQWSRTLDIQAGTTDRLVVVDDPVREGRHALRATVKYGDLNNNGARAEVVLASPQFREGDERWFHWYTMFPADFVASSSWMLFTQWHSNGFGVPVRLGMRGETVSFRVMGHQYDRAGQWDAGTLWKAPLERGRWNEYLLHVKFSDNPKIGFVELWVNGAPVVPKTMHATLELGDSVYLKMGLYRDRSVQWDQHIYHDGMTVYADDPRLGAPSSAPPTETESFTDSPTLDNPVMASKAGGCGSDRAALAALFFPAPFLLRFFRPRTRRRQGNRQPAK